MTIWKEIDERQNKEIDRLIKELDEFLAMTKTYQCPNCEWKGQYDLMTEEDNRWLCPECDEVILKNL